ncbi:MAG: pyridine nucleotide-disulfide oxidoreductase [Proteobacteria bacterium]|nr:pyridine nucleotide-disulfide oxidoreductase [Pseudomonadota bacterium]
MMNDIKDLPLGITGFKFSDLYLPSKLKELHTEFWKYCEETAPETAKKFRELNSTTPYGEEGNVLVDTAKVVGEFIAKLFNITNHTALAKAATRELQPTFKLKKDFLNIRVFKRFTESPCSSDEWKKLDSLIKKVLAQAPQQNAKEAEVQFAETVILLLESEKLLKTGSMAAPEQNRLQSLLIPFPGSNLNEKVIAALKAFEDWSVQVWVDKERRKAIEGWGSFVRAEKLDFEHLVETIQPKPQLPEMVYGPAEHLRHRVGFKLTDPRMTTKEYLREVDYCIYCHERKKDSCSKGFEEKTGGYKKNPLGIPLTGCPLDERISEMHVLRRDGELIGALSMIMLDNPMCPGTGHRICNDCMKGCIFQKQDPVNIPQTETGTLSDVLNLPYGFEIYSLLTRWNPINRKRPYALPYNGKNILVVGLGPAGYTAAHYFANEGFGVVGIDALKLEPVDPTLTGKGKAFPKPIQNFSDLKKELDERFLMGFGGVSEYGITVRWDKNFLSVIYLSLLRRQGVRFYGGVRFGGTINLEDAWKLGFHHVALATGAGKPTIIEMKNNLSRGIRKASDFLMALQLTGAFKKPSMANLQVRLPALVIGGGLTAIDTATELMAYYPLQVEKALERFEGVSRAAGEEATWAMCSPEEKEILKTFIEHGKAIREERAQAKKEKRQPNFIKLCREWGGVSVAYRKKLTDSPAYRLNHEEVEKALEEGIGFIENMTPTEAIKDQYGAVEALVFKRANGENVTLPAKSVMVAAGTSPNTIYEREFPGSFKLDDRGNFFKKYRAEKTGDAWKLVEGTKTDNKAFLLSYEKEGKFVSYYGDNHPDYAGNVVKAMASAKHGTQEVFKLFENEIRLADSKPSDSAKFEELTKHLDETFVPRVVKVVRLTETIVEVIVKGHYAATRFEPGQFYRFQNYESTSHMIDGSRLTMEALALTGAWVDKEKDLLSMIVLEMGGSSKLCSILKPGEPVVVMGPTGAPSEIAENETVLLAGGGLGNAVLLSISRALKARNCKVLYFAGYKKSSDLFKQHEIEEATDQMIWATDSGEAIKPNRPQDRTYVGNIVKAMEAYGKGDLGGAPMFPLNTVDRIFVIGSDRMMAAVGAARHGVLKPYLKQDHVAIASVNSPMQCMMKEVCAQCLQRHVDPVTGKETFVFSCFNQDQEIDKVDFVNLNDRLKTNSLLEKLSDRYLDGLLKKGSLEKI